MADNYELFPETARPQLVAGLKETPQTPEKHALLQRAAKSKKRERLRWHNIDPEIDRAGRVGCMRFWLAPATLTAGAPPMQVLELYCRNEACRFRSINIVEKLVDQPFPRPDQPLRCPGCGAPAQLMWRVSGEDYAKQKQTMFDSALE